MNKKQKSKMMKKKRQQKNKIVRKLFKPVEPKHCPIPSLFGGSLTLEGMTENPLITHLYYDETYIDDGGKIRYVLIKEDCNKILDKCSKCMEQIFEYKELLNSELYRIFSADCKILYDFVGSMKENNVGVSWEHLKDWASVLIYEDLWFCYKDVKYEHEFILTDITDNIEKIIDQSFKCKLQDVCINLNK